MSLETWIQVIASIGVVAGLILVAYELRENRLFAIAEAKRSAISEWANVSRAQFESEIFEVYVKSFESPESMSSAEMLKMGSWLTSTVGLFDLQYRMYEIGLADDPTADLVNDFQYYLGSRFARAWYAENRSWLSPHLVEVIDNEIVKTPVETKSSYIEGLRSLLEADGKATTNQ